MNIMHDGTYTATTAMAVMMPNTTLSEKPPKRRGRPRAAIKSAGKRIGKAKIAKHWKAQGRSGNCYKTTGMLINTRKLKRTPIKGQKRGSIYVAV